MTDHDSDDREPIIRRLWLIRHGQSTANLGARCEVDEDDHLTELGRLQTEATAAILAPLIEGEVVIVTSTLTRARETGDLVAKGLAGRPVRADPRLIEKSFDESLDEVFQRAMACLRPLHVESECVLCVTHGHVLQALASKALSITDLSSLEPDNCGISMVQENRWVTWNFVGHLTRLRG